MPFNPTVNGAGGFNATVNGQAAFLASMSVVGIKGDTGATGPAGISSVIAPLSLDALTKVLSIDLSAYATKDSPALTGNPTAPTQPEIASGTVIATCGFVKSLGYLKATDAAAIYQTIAGMSGYATQSWVTSQGYLTSAPVTSVAGRTGAITLSTSDISGLGTAAVQDVAYWLRSPAVAGTDGQIVSWDAATSRPLWIDNAARTLFATVRNETGATLTKGTVVYINGASGNKATVTKAQANSDATSAQTFAVISADIATNQNGTAIVAGELTGLNTSGYTEGAALYLSPTTAGTFTTTKPSAPNHLVYVATVVRSHANQGVIEVRIQNGYELDEIHDVAISGKADKDLLVYESSSTLWKNKSFATLDLLTATTAAATYYLASNPAGYVTASTAPVTSVAGKTGAVMLAVADVSGAAPTASPTFTGDPKAPTPATSDNDTSIATTAFVNAYCPSASTSTAGKVQLATDAQSIAGTSATLAITPASLEAQAFDQDFHNYYANAWTATTSGTGASTAQTLNAKSVNAPTSATGYGLLSQGLYAAVRGGNANAGFGWGKRYAASFRLVNVGASADANSVGRVLFGKGNAVTTTGLSTRGFGIQLTVGGTLQILAHDGTTLTTYNTSHTFVAATAIDITLTLSSTGTVTCYVNGSSVGSTTGGPTSGSVSAGNAIHLEAENTATLSGTRLQLIIQNPRIHAAVS